MGGWMDGRVRLFWACDDDDDDGDDDALVLENGRGGRREETCTQKIYAFFSMGRVKFNETKRGRRSSPSSSSYDRFFQASTGRFSWASEGVG